MFDDKEIDCVWGCVQDIEVVVLEVSVDELDFNFVGLDCKTLRGLGGGWIVWFKAFSCWMFKRRGGSGRGGKEECSYKCKDPADSLELEL